MDQTIISAVPALAGTIVGAITSFATTWFITTSQTAAARVAAERSKREGLYGRYMEQLAALYADALQRETVNYDKFATAYALRGQILLIASRPVFDIADQALRFIIDVTLGPRRTDEEMRKMMDEKQHDVVGDFAEACRREIEGLR
jgi:hypothetical protein